MNNIYFFNLVNLNLQRPRPHFGARAPFVERNPITGNKEPAFPQNVQYLRMAAGHAVITLMVFLLTFIL